VCCCVEGSSVEDMVGLGLGCDILLKGIMWRIFWGWNWGCDLVYLGLEWRI
jgi:hypothetical protein